MPAAAPSPWLRRFFHLAVAFSALTGFAQMPIFKRYYIADIPGLGWLAQYHLTYTLHYFSAILVAGLGAYLLTAYRVSPRSMRRTAPAGYVDAGLLLLIVASGGLLVIRNLPGYRFTPRSVVALDFTHLGLVLIFLLWIAAALPLRRRRRSAA